MTVIFDVHQARTVRLTANSAIPLLSGYVNGGEGEDEESGVSTATRWETVIDETKTAITSTELDRDVVLRSWSIGQADTEDRHVGGDELTPLRVDFVLEAPDRDTGLWCVRKIYDAIEAIDGVADGDKHVDIKITPLHGR